MDKSGKSHHVVRDTAAVELQTERLILRNWRDDDLDAFHRLNSDDDIMKYFPVRRSRKEAKELMPTWAAYYLQHGYGFGAIEDKSTGHVVGIAGLADYTDPIDIPDTSLEIGWRLIPEVWEQGVASEAATAWMDFAINDLKQRAICAFAVATNMPSIAVMKRLGMTELADSPFENPMIPESHPDLIPHVLFGITAQRWVSQKTR